MSISFSDIPRHQNLFLDYLYEFENVSNYYKSDFRKKEEYLNIFRKVSDNYKEREFKISSIIRNQYKTLPALSAKTDENIKKLSEDKTIAIVTGQQLGIIGGPLYTFYKIITSIKLSEQLAERYDEYNFVPVFWLEGDDHDFNEVRSINVINENNELKNIGYGEELEPDTAKESVGSLEFDETIKAFFKSLKEKLRSSDFSDDLFTDLENFYKEGESFKSAFRKLIFNYFDKHGLVQFDPQDENVKNLLMPVFQKEVENFREHTQKLVSVSAKLEETYHAQVKVKPVNMFYHTDGGRYSIEPVDDYFRLKRKRKQFGKDELVEEIQNFPERFSPNVLLRPICQDFLLPTGFYIGGPSEIAYFAQVTPLYDFFNIQTPIIYPRSSATIIEKNISSAFEKFDLNLNSVFLGEEELKEKIISEISNDNLEGSFDESIKNTELIYDKLKEILYEIDKTTADASAKYRDKSLHNLNELKGKALKAQERKYETTLTQIKKVITFVYPNDNLQEREINFSYFYNKYGEEFIETIFKELSVTEFEHQEIYI